MTDLEAIRTLDEMLDRHNIELTGIGDAAPLVFMLRSESGDIYAGIHGFSWGGYFEIKTLFVTESYRGRGIGGTLLKATETEAAHRNCQRIILSTHGFQAPHFYEKHGYGRVATIENCPQGDAYILMVKVL